MTYQETKARVVELTKQLNQLNYRYYVCNVSDVSDQEFDNLMRELMELEKQYPEMTQDDSPTKRVGSDLQQEFKHVKHSTPMLSLANAYNVDELLQWYESVKAVYGKDVAIAYEPKYDGLSISLIYAYGRLEKAITRGNGIEGDDVTENVRCIERVPLVIDQPDIKSMMRFEIRGEVLMPYQSFRRLNEQREASGEELFANPRNAAAGTLKSTRSSVVRERGLDVYLYEVPTIYRIPKNRETYDTDHEFIENDQCDLMDYLFVNGVPTAQSFHVNQGGSGGSVQPVDRAKLENVIYDFTLRRPLMDYPIDGIVFKVADRHQRSECGTTSKSPKWAIAYKFEAERRYTTVRNVTFQVGRTGAVTPVVHFDPIPLAGTLVRKATGNNADFLHEMHIAIGGRIAVEKGGDIIPKIVEGVDPYATKGFQEVTYPDRCPDCGAPLVRDGSIYYCIGEQCPAQLQARLEHFVSREAMNIQGIGPKMIEAWIEQGKVKDISDITSLRSDITSAMSSKIIDAIITSIHTTPAHRVLYALGIRYIGENTAKLLLKQHGDISVIATIATACPSVFMNIEGIGENIASSLAQWFSDKENMELLCRLQQAGLQMKSTTPYSSSANEGNLPLEGLTIVISGVFEKHSRDEYRAMIEQYGGKNGSSVSKNTDYVLAGDNMGPSKREKAESLGIEIINEEQFLALINETH